MKAILLAAGEGSRLRPYTADRPKCMVELGGQPLIEWQISTLRACGVDEIVLVTGYRAEALEREDVRSYHNPLFETTNMVESLWCAEEELSGDVIISYADIVYEPRLVDSLLNDDSDLCVVVDRQWDALWKVRFDDPLDDAETLKIDSGGHLAEIGQPASSYDQIDAQYIGLMRFKDQGLSRLRSIYETARSTAQKGGDPWGLSRPFEKAYMTDLLQALINDGQDLKAVQVDRGWFEIDSVTDYEMMRTRFSDGNITEFFDPAAVAKRT